MPDIFFSTGIKTLPRCRVHRRNRTRRSHGGACVFAVLWLYVLLYNGGEVRRRRCAAVDREHMFLFQLLRLYEMYQKVRVALTFLALHFYGSLEFDMVEMDPNDRPPNNAALLS